MFGRYRIVDAERALVIISQFLPHSLHNQSLLFHDQHTAFINFHSFFFIIILQINGHCKTDCRWKNSIGKKWFEFDILQKLINRKKYFSRYLLCICMIILCSHGLDGWDDKFWSGPNANLLSKIFPRWNS